ncbi:hypothetical protein AB7308_08675, partial [Escherichia coli]
MMNSTNKLSVIIPLYNAGDDFRTCMESLITQTWTALWICPYISRHLLSLNPLQARCRRYSRG